MTQLLCRSNYCRPADFGGPRRVEPGRPLCRQCADKLQPTLARLASMWPDLRARAAVEDREGEKITGTKMPGIVINEPVSDLSRELTRWARRLAFGVLFEHPQAQRPRTFEPSDVLPWLARYYAWRLAYHDNHDSAVAACEWAEHYRREVRRLAYPSGTRRVEIRGHVCPAMRLSRDDAGVPIVDEAGGLVTETCGGQLYALIRDRDADRPTELVCDVDDEHRVPSKQWLKWARRGIKRDSGQSRGLPDGAGDLRHYGIVDQDGV